jgi:TonB family protein
MRKQSALYSVCIHLALVTLLLVTATLSTYTKTTRYETTSLTPPRTQELYAPRIRVPENQGGSGGGLTSPLPPARGEIPKVARVFIPPTPRTVEQPKIILPSGLGDMPQIAMDVPIGVPNGIFQSNSPGPGKKGGIGTGCCGRAGDGNGPDNGPGNGPRAARGGMRLSALPQLLWKTEPEYSEEARKARFQGSVLLAMEIDSEGHPRNIRVVRSLGLGLDERAVAAVAQWKFKPGILNGHPVSSPVSVEVSFRLL